MVSERRIEGDWFDGVIPANVDIHPQAFVESAYSFRNFRSGRANALRLGRGSSVYRQSEFDVGPDGLIEIGEFTMLNSARLVCDRRITMGSHCLVSWNVIIMDSRRTAMDVASRRRLLAGAISDDFQWPTAPVPGDPVAIGNNVWIGFDVIILPGLTIGDGAVIGARSVVDRDIPAYSVAVGNPARVVRQLDPIAESRLE